MSRGAAVFLSALVTTAGACSSSGGMGGSTDAAGGGGRAAPVAGGPAGGAGGATSASIDAIDGPAEANRPTDAGSRVSDAATALDAEAVCRDAIAAYCQRYATCTGYTANPSCQASIDLCPAYYFSAGSTRTVAGVAACLTEIAQQPCTDISFGLSPSCLTEGTGAVGTPCAYPSQCLGNSCSSAGYNGCGICQMLEVAAAGAPCPQRRCQRGYFCHPTKMVCQSGATIVHAALGQPCNLQADPVVACEGALDCRPTAPGGTSYTCRPRAGLGEPCVEAANPAACAPGLTCGPTAVCERIGLCGAVVCDANSYCATATTTCLPRAREGEGCHIADPGGPDHPCLATLNCVPVDPAVSVSNRHCVTRGRRGDPCVDVCEYRALSCVAGRCVPLDPATCSAPGA